MKSKKAFDLYDKKVRQELLSDPKLFAKDTGHTVEDDVEVKVCTSTKDTYYFAITYNDISTIKFISAAATDGCDDGSPPPNVNKPLFCFCI